MPTWHDKIILEVPGKDTMAIDRRFLTAIKPFASLSDREENWGQSIEIMNIKIA